MSQKEEHHHLNRKDLNLGTKVVASKYIPGNASTLKNVESKDSITVDIKDNIDYEFIADQFKPTLDYWRSKDKDKTT